MMKKAALSIILLICLVVTTSGCSALLAGLSPSSIPASTTYSLSPTSTPSTTIATTTSSTTTQIPTPTPTVNTTGSIGQVSQSTQSIPMSYKWSYGNKQWTWDLQIPEALYDYYEGLPRSPTKNYSVYVTHPSDDAYIAQLVNKIEQVAQEEGYSEFQKVSFAASFVQNLPYTSDSLSKGYDEYPRYPIETLVDSGGDCEDTAILTASLLSTMGYGTVLLIFPSSADVQGHCAVGIKGGEGIYGTYWEYEDSKYYYLETTNTGWEIGQIPEEYKTANAYIYAMIPVPILAHKWTASRRGNIVDLEIKVSNLGSAPANDTYVLAGFDAGENMLWGRQISSTFNLSIGQEATITFHLEAPTNQHTRLVIQVVYGGYAVDQSYSEWFDT